MKLQESDVDGALQAFSLSLKKKPLQPSIWFKVGALQMHKEAWDDSLQSFSQAVMQVHERRKDTDDLCRG